METKLSKELFQSNKDVEMQQKKLLEEAKSILDKLDKFDLKQLKKRIFKGASDIDVYIKVFGSRVFTEKKIKAMCFKYGLVLRDSNQFCGKIENTTLEKINKFETDYQKAGFKFETRWNEIQNKYVMIAPGNQFTKPQNNYDPALFYQVSDDIFIFIDSWGNDFSFLRKIYGFLLTKWFYFTTLIPLLLISQFNIDSDKIFFTSVLIVLGNIAAVAFLDMHNCFFNRSWK